MNSESAGSSKKNKKRDPDLAAAEVAMQRAARKARERARLAGLGVFVVKDGQIVEERSDS